MFKDLFKFISNIFYKEDLSLVNVTQYPNEYVIETFNSSDTGVWVRSSFISLLPIEFEINEFDSLIISHLDASKKVNYRKYNLKLVNENYKKVTKKKTLKKQMEEAKKVSIYRKNNLIELTPSINGGTSGDLKGFRPIVDKKVTLNKELDTNHIALNVIKLFAECV